MYLDMTIIQAGNYSLANIKNILAVHLSRSKCILHPCPRQANREILKLIHNNHSEKTALVIKTPLSSTRLIMNDLEPCLSNRRIHKLGSGHCHTCIRLDIGSSNSPTAV